MQTELNLLGLLKAPEPIRSDLLLSFGDDEEVAVKASLKWAWLHRRVKMTQRLAAEHIGVKPSHFANIINGKKYLPPHKINAFEWIVGHRAVSLTVGAALVGNKKPTIKPDDLVRTKRGDGIVHQIAGGLPAAADIVDGERWLDCTSMISTSCARRRRSRGPRTAPDAAHPAGAARSRAMARLEVREEGSTGRRSREDAVLRRRRPPRRQAGQRGGSAQAW
jgi:hypothetical protein